MKWNTVVQLPFRCCCPCVAWSVFSSTTWDELIEEAEYFCLLHGSLSLSWKFQASGYVINYDDAFVPSLSLSASGNVSWRDILYCRKLLKLQEVRKEWLPRCLYFASTLEPGAFQPLLLSPWHLLGKICFNNNNRAQKRKNGNDDDNVGLLPRHCQLFGSQPDGAARRLSMRG